MANHNDNGEQQDIFLEQEDEENVATSGSSRSSGSDRSFDQNKRSLGRDLDFTASQVEVDILFWRNLALAFVAGSGIVLCVAAHLSLQHWSDLDETRQEKFSGVFTAVLAGNFCLMALIFYLFARHVTRRLTQRQTSVRTKNMHKDSSGTAPTIHCSHTTALPVATVESDSFIGQGKAVVTSTNNTTAVAVDNLHDYWRREAGLGVAVAEQGYQGKPMAELFTDTTILFADIEGFTAWSSTRVPQQVFVLLETLYHAFDVIARRRKVFKVETVGDCYVAVTGLPEPRKDHAIVMAGFACDILKRMRPICKQLILSLGPDTCELNIRIGMHSGPVTGGLLRGERSRFQLFGDSVNTASRIESTGQGGQIHISHATAELLQNAGKGHWVSKRSVKVVAKGLGAIQTYWLHRNNDNQSVSDSHSTSSHGEESEDEDDQHHNNRRKSLSGSASSTTNLQSPLSTCISNAKFHRLVSWNVDLLHRLLKQIVARRELLVNANPNRKADADESIYMKKREGTLLEEVKESIELPSFNYSHAAAEQGAHIQLDPDVYNQLQNYVQSVAEMYPDHAFHNFEHASHVAMSVAKLLNRIVAPSSLSLSSSNATEDETFGITSDPLTQFACVLSALIHDADHPGVPNATLVKEQTVEANLYSGKSIAEQHSVDRCWNLLMEPRYSALRKTIYTTNNGLRRFRSLVVNSVLATDICDPDLKNLRNSRWERAFNKASNTETAKAAKDRKATIVIEHLIQASDVSHTMQHWHIYRRWNERLFQECFKAYKEGRADKDPSESWYEGEKGFFDFYIIPLAKKLKECGVFGVCSNEYLDYALRNREEWEHHGKEVVEDMIANVKNQEQIMDQTTH